MTAASQKKAEYLEIQLVPSMPSFLVSFFSCKKGAWWGTRPSNNQPHPQKTETETQRATIIWDLTPREHKPY